MRSATGHRRQWLPSQLTGQALSAILLMRIVEGRIARLFLYSLCLSTIVLLAASCSPKSDPETSWPGPSWSSDHFVYHARPDDTSVHAGVLAYLEANGDLVAQAVLGLDPAQWGPIQYFKYRDDADFADGNPCGGTPDTAGCCVYFSDGRIEIHSPLAVDPHELVHAYAKSLGDPPTFLLEGLAVNISCDPSPEQVLGGLDGWPRYNFAKTTWTQYYPFTNAGPEQYFAAGMLTTWMVDRTGMSGLLGLRGRSEDEPKQYWVGKRRAGGRPEQHDRNGLHCRCLFHLQRWGSDWLHGAHRGLVLLGQPAEDGTPVVQRAMECAVSERSAERSGAILRPAWFALKAALRLLPFGSRATAE